VVTPSAALLFVAHTRSDSEMAAGESNRCAARADPYPRGKTNPRASVSHCAGMAGQDRDR
jgi:hypothetical protein